VIGIACPIVCRSGMVTGYPIISEIAPVKEEAGVAQGLVARHGERWVVWLREKYLKFFYHWGIIIELGKVSTIFIDHYNLVTSAQVL
jgi:hypothetical protein